jgi:hypothetical protein
MNYKREMSFEEACRQPMDAPIRLEELRKEARRKKHLEFLETYDWIEFKNKIEEARRKRLDNQQSESILPMLKEDR